MLGNLIGDQWAVTASILLTFLLGIGVGSFTAHRLWGHLWLLEGGIGLYAALFALGSTAREAFRKTVAPEPAHPRAQAALEQLETRD